MACWSGEVPTAMIDLRQLKVVILDRDLVFSVCLSSSVVDTLAAFTACATHRGETDNSVYNIRF